MRRILSIDGGGCKGLIPTAVLKSVEGKIRCSICKKFDLILGSSIGGLIGAALASNVVSASSLVTVLRREFPSIFKKRLRIPFIQPKYSNEYKGKLLRTYFNDMIMNCCQTKFVSTGVNIVDGRTHFFKSWEEDDGKIPVKEVVLRTTAAPLYFGSVIDHKDKAVWIDGGCADYNSTAIYGLIEAIRQGWLENEHVHILSLGCGQSSHKVPFKKAKRFRNARQVLYFTDPTKGGLARARVSQSQNFELTTYAESCKNFSYQRIERTNLPKSMDKMDKLKFLDSYIKIGEELSNYVDYSFLT